MTLTTDGWLLKSALRRFDRPSSPYSGSASGRLTRTPIAVKFRHHFVEKVQQKGDATGPLLDLSAKDAGHNSVAARLTPSETPSLRAPCKLQIRPREPRRHQCAPTTPHLSRSPWVVG